MYRFKGTTGTEVKNLLLFKQGVILLFRPPGVPLNTGSPGCFADNILGISDAVYHFILRAIQVIQKRRVSKSSLKSIIAATIDMHIKRFRIAKVKVLHLSPLMCHIPSLSCPLFSPKKINNILV